MSTRTFCRWSAQRPLDFDALRVDGDVEGAGRQLARSRPVRPGEGQTDRIERTHARPLSSGDTDGLSYPQLMILGLVLLAIAAVPVLACLGAALAFAARFRPDRVGSATEPVPLSVLVPVKGVDAATEDNFEALVASRLPGPVEYRFAMESADDPAYAVAERVRERHPDLDIAVVITGPAGDRMGKQHNLAAAAVGAKHPTIASMDADVQVNPDTLTTGLRALAAPDSGVVYMLPRYRGPGPAGGALVAI
jgi:hypothetical protein